ncbi:MAG: trifunctional dihydropteroate synthetase [Caeruleum heppii]|nr:MAG: trifunctional dihydropteroate synthetase [Caeruleum heppii]
MGILNITPDSFSDGGIHTTTSTSTLLSTVSSFISGGATILDIGGQSTRPNAPSITAAEEISRILPAIHAIRTSPLPETRTVILSVDTYRAAVAEAAIAAGADLINDVSAGTLDPAMLPTVARLGCSISLMHMRGTPSTMTSLASYPDGVIPTVARELLARVVAAEKAGIRRWRIMLDPGLGFAKNASQNLELLRCMSSLRDFEPLRGLPWLLGPSRKGFVGRVTGVERPAERIWGTAGCVSACVAGEADVVRVHDVGEMAQVVRMADAIWRV